LLFFLNSIKIEKNDHDDDDDNDDDGDNSTFAMAFCYGEHKLSYWCCWWYSTQTVMPQLRKFRRQALTIL